MAVSVIKNAKLVVEEKTKPRGTDFNDALKQITNECDDGNIHMGDFTVVGLDGGMFFSYESSGFFTVRNHLYMSNGTAVWRYDGTAI